MQNLIEQYNSIKPDKSWVKQTRKDLKSQMPSSHWQAYSGAFVIAVVLALSAISYEGHERIEKQIHFSKTITQEHAVATVKQAKKVSKKIEQSIEKQIKEVQEVQAVKTESSSEDDINILTKLLEDLENAKANTKTIEEIEELIKKGDFVLAREKLDKLIINGKNIDKPSNSD